MTKRQLESIHVSKLKELAWFQDRIHTNFNLNLYYAGRITRSELKRRFIKTLIKPGV